LQAASKSSGEHRDRRWLSASTLACGSAPRRWTFEQKLRRYRALGVREHDLVERVAMPRAKI